MSDDSVSDDSVSDDDDRKIMISAVGVSKTFGTGGSSSLVDRFRRRGHPTPHSFTALHDVSFNVYEGETFGLLGHNGSGKSTMLKLLAAIMVPSTGRITVEGRLAALLELGAGFHPEMTGRENVHLNASILGFDRAFVDSRFEEIVVFAELERFIDMPVKHYSSGMRARLGFAVATHLRPDILLVDEVLSVGDMAFQEKCMTRVHDFRSSGRTMVLVSHSPGRVIELCDRAMVLHGGNVLHIGSPAKAVDVYREAMAERSTRSSGAGSSTAQQGGGSEDTGDGNVGGETRRPARLVDAGLITDLDTGAGPADPVTMEPGGRLTCWADVEADEAMEVRFRILIRVPGGLAMVNRSTSTIGAGEPIALAAGPSRIGFTFTDLALESGRYNVALFLESPDGRLMHAVRAPVGELRIDGGLDEAGPLQVTVGFTCEATVAPVVAQGTDSRSHPVEGSSDRSAGPVEVG